MSELQTREKELLKQLRAKQSKLLDLDVRLEELEALNGGLLLWLSCGVCTPAAPFAV